MTLKEMISKGNSVVTALTEKSMVKWWLMMNSVEEIMKILNVDKATAKAIIYYQNDEDERAGLI